MDKKSSNRISIIIAILIGIFILGGVFLLNASFGKKNSQNKDSSANNKVSSKSSSRSSSSTSSNSSQKTSSINSSSSSSLNSSNSSNSSSSSNSKSSIDSDIKEGQIVAKILSRNENTYQLEILDSKVKDSKYFAPGNKINRLNISGVDMSEGKTYKIQLSVEDRDGGFSVSNFQVLGELKS
jgi:cytoskeletal protein RodZ